MAEEETTQPIDDPFDTVADSTNSAEAEEQDAPDEVQEAEAEANAMNSAEAEEQDDSTEAQETAAEAIPPVGEVLSKTVYATCYYLSYGVVFGSSMLANAIPMDNAMGAGLRDGADAARNAVQKRAAEWTVRRAEQGVEGTRAN